MKSALLALCLVASVSLSGCALIEPILKEYYGEDDGDDGGETDHGEKGKDDRDKGHGGGDRGDSHGGHGGSHT